MMFGIILPPGSLAPANGNGNKPDDADFLIGARDPPWWSNVI